MNMADFLHFTDEQVAAYLEGKGNISDLEFLNEMSADPLLDAVVDIVDSINDLEDISEISDTDEIKSMEDLDFK